MVSALRTVGVIFLMAGVLGGGLMILGEAGSGPNINAVQRAAAFATYATAIGVVIGGVASGLFFLALGEIVDHLAGIRAALQRHQTGERATTHQAG